MSASSAILIQLHCISFAFVVAYAIVNHHNRNGTLRSSSDIIDVQRIASEQQQEEEKKKRTANHNHNNNMSTEEPPAKKAKSADDWKDHKMNMEECVMKADETKLLSEIAEGDLRVLQGIGPKADKVLESMGLQTIKDLAGTCV